MYYYWHEQLSPVGPPHNDWGEAGPHEDEVHEEAAGPAVTVKEGVDEPGQVEVRQGANKTKIQPQHLFFLAIIMVNQEKGKGTASTLIYPNVIFIMSQKKLCLGPGSPITNFKLSEVISVKASIGSTGQ